MSTQTLISERLEIAPQELAAFCRRWQIAVLEVFGSILREDFGTASDVDFLVSFEPGGGPAGMDWFQMKEELVRLVGCQVDVLDRRLVEQSRNLYRRQHILGEATPIHGSAWEGGRWQWPAGR
jgi:uncharacterized protein